MKFCPDCGVKRPKNTNICVCGFDFEKHHKKQNLKNKHIHQSIKQQFEQSSEDIKLYSEQISKRRMNHFYVWSTIAAIAFTICTLFYDTSINFIIGFVFILVCLNIFQLKLTKNQYYSLKSSRNKNGEHQCIFCGNKGIYKSTIYKTSSVVHKCSKCQQTLFVD